MSALTLDELRRAVARDGAAIRCVTRLQPAAGEGTKIFPPTFATGDRVLKYVTEQRRIDGQTVDCVLLDSVASQANRMEQALLRAWDGKQLDFPVLAVDFSGEDEITDLDRITTLDAPHRIADAIFRDSVTDDGTLFRDTPLGRAYTDATVTNATGVYQSCPTALIFGCWDSTGPKGGLGNKIQRLLVSEIVGVNAQTGKKTASRIDPAGIQANVDIYHAEADHDDWTIDPEKAEQKSKKPLPFSRKGGDGKGKPSAINHGNVAPSVDEFAGGVTVDYAEQTTVLSLPALRRLRFQTTCTGKPLQGPERQEAELAGRTALAALSLAAVAFARADGYDLRSRCLLVPAPGGPLSLEVISADGGEPRSFSLDTDAAASLQREALKASSSHGLGWDRQPLRLVPAPKLAALIRRSRELAARGEGVEATETP